jgi:hypothetical protein
MRFVRRKGLIMLTAAQCQKFADEYKSLARQTDVTEQRVALLKNVARSFVGVASQLDRLDALVREETQSTVRAKRNALGQAEAGRMKEAAN